MTPRIDAHQHFWHIARGDYSWLTPALGAIYRDFNPEDLAPNPATHATPAPILVQAAPTHAETAFPPHLAAFFPFKRFVGETKPIFGKRRWSGIWPPSKPTLW